LSWQSIILNTRFFFTGTVYKRASHETNGKLTGELQEKICCDEAPTGSGVSRLSER
jgi:hypothetical protein